MELIKNNLNLLGVKLNFFVYESCLINNKMVEKNLINNNLINTILLGVVVLLLGLVIYYIFEYLKHPFSNI